MRLIYYFIIVFFLFIGLSACCNADNNNSQTDVPKKQTDSVNVVSDEVAAAYQCSMKCEGEKTYNVAGQCPECKMDLKEIK